MKKLMLLALLVSAPYLYCMDIESAGEEKSMQEEKSEENRAMQEENPHPTGRVIRKVRDFKNTTNDVAMEEETKTSPPKRTKNFAEDEDTYSDEEYDHRKKINTARQSFSTAAAKRFQPMSTEASQRFQSFLSQFQHKIGSEDVFEPHVMATTKVGGHGHAARNIRLHLAFEYLKFAVSRHLGITQSEMNAMKVLFGPKIEFKHGSDNKYYLTNLNKLTVDKYVTDAE